MNRSMKIVVMTAAVIIAAMCIYPPYSGSVGIPSPSFIYEYDANCYAPIFAPPGGQNYYEQSEPPKPSSLEATLGYGDNGAKKPPARDLLAEFGLDLPKQQQRWMFCSLGGNDAVLNTRKLAIQIFAVLILSGGVLVFLYDKKKGDIP